MGRWERRQQEAARPPQGLPDPQLPPGRRECVCECVYECETPEDGAVISGWPKHPLTQVSRS